MNGVGVDVNSASKQLLMYVSGLGPQLAGNIVAHRDENGAFKTRAQLKKVHQEFNHTMIYVTHDQTEALTFADLVVVMHEGTVVQIGTPVELFESPKHTFVGHFIGSPGMNVLPCEIDQGAPILAGWKIEVETRVEQTMGGARLEIGVRPEFVSFSSDGPPYQRKTTRNARGAPPAKKLSL